MLDIININMDNLVEWINTHQDNTLGKYDEIVDLNICTTHPSIPHNQAMIIYTGLNNAGIDQQRSLRVTDLEAFAQFTGLSFVA